MDTTDETTADGHQQREVMWSAAGIDDLRRRMMQQGLSFEDAAVAAGIAAEYAQAAYMRGHNRGYNQSKAT